ncbi:MFS transporter [Methanobrevibacter sp.]|uniref:MFS transporter n=1 Tax=Methanobrevibacter sp. TaxID=66852 RepID=UPI003869229B
MMQLIANMTVVALPDIAVALNFSAEGLLWVNLIYLMSFVSFSLPFAKIISQYGIKKSTKLSIILLFISIALSFLAVNEYMFLLSRLLQGLTSAALAISIYVIIVEEFQENEMGSALGMVSSAGYVGMLMAPSFMGFVIYFADWKFAFLILIPILLVLLYLLNNVSKEWAGEKKPIDNKSSFFYIVIMALFAYGLTELDEYGMIFLVISLIMLVILIKIEKKVEEPILNFNLINNTRYVIGNYAAMVSYFTTTIAITALSFHLQYILNFEEYIVSMILIISPIIMIGMSNIGGMLSNKFDPRLISATAMIFLAISMTIYFFVDHIPFEIILVGCVFQGIGNGLFSAPNNKYTLTIVDEEDLADASSILSSSKEFGKILSTGIYTLILSIFFGNQTLGPEDLDYLLVQSSNLMMFICMILSVSAAILLLYSFMKYEKGINKGTVEFFKSITPKRILKKNKISNLFK